LRCCALPPWWLNSVLITLFGHYLGLDF